MVLVESIKAHVVDGNMFNFAKMSLPDEPVWFGDNEEPVMAKVITELVSGRRFRSPTKGEIVIGWAEDVQKALGLPFEAFENQGQEISRLCREAGVLRNRLNNFIKMSFWERLRFLFDGKEKI